MNEISSYNLHELVVIRMPQEKGWEVVNSGWPDLLAIKDGVVRFIEVKQPGQNLKPNQEKVKKILEFIPGLKVEILKPCLKGIVQKHLRKDKEILRVATKSVTKSRSCKQSRCRSEEERIKIKDLVRQSEKKEAQRLNEFRSI